jgi:HPt (histidine-containing phosphotransfer) domain-containing protein
MDLMPLPQADEPITAEEQVPETVTAEDAEELREKMIEIKEMCADYDREGAMELIAEMKSYSQKTKQVLDKINAFVRHSEFDEAKKAAAAYIDELFNEPGQENAYQQTRTKLLTKGVKGLDIAKGLNRYDGDEEIYIKILRSFTDSVQSLLDLMQVVKEEELHSYRIRVHGIKGSSYDIFADSVGKIAEKLEDAATAGDIDYIREHNPPFLEAAGGLIRDIRHMLSAINAENVRQKKEKPDTELLQKILSACEDFNLKRSEEALTEIEKYQYTADDGLAEWLRKNLDMMNFQQIANKLSELNPEKN